MWVEKVYLFENILIYMAKGTKNEKGCKIWWKLISKRRAV